MRGENTLAAKLCHVTHGSSPRARGKRDMGKPERQAQRIIPACAGKTIGIRTKFLLFADHPRVRGENNCGYTSATTLAGSSPRARGKLYVYTFVLNYKRIIPACAGKTFMGPKNSFSAADHPRVRGENVFALSF